MHEVISLSECARRLGVRLRAVQKAIQTNRVTSVKRTEQGRFVGVEWPAAREEWARNTDPSQAAKNGKVWLPVSPAQPEMPQSDAAAADPADGDDLVTQQPAPAQPAGEATDAGYHEHRAAREKYNAELTRIELLQKLGALVPAAAVQKAAETTARVVRDALLVMPDRVAAQLAAETDPARVHAVLTAEIRTALNGLADRAVAVAA